MNVLSTFCTYCYGIFIGNGTDLLICFVIHYDIRYILVPEKTDKLVIPFGYGRSTVYYKYGYVGFCEYLVGFFHTELAKSALVVESDGEADASSNSAGPVYDQDARFLAD